MVGTLRVRGCRSGARRPGQVPQRPGGRPVARHCDGGNGDRGGAGVRGRRHLGTHHPGPSPGARLRPRRAARPRRGPPAGRPVRRAAGPPPRSAPDRARRRDARRRGRSSSPGPRHPRACSSSTTLRPPARPSPPPRSRCGAPAPSRCSRSPPPGRHRRGDSYDFDARAPVLPGSTVGTDGHRGPRQEPSGVVSPEVRRAGEGGAHRQVHPRRRTRRGRLRRAEATPSPSRKLCEITVHLKRHFVKAHAGHRTGGRARPRGRQGGASGLAHQGQAGEPLPPRRRTVVQQR